MSESDWESYLGENSRQKACGSDVRESCKQAKPPARETQMQSRALVGVTLPQLHALPLKGS